MALEQYRAKRNFQRTPEPAVPEEDVAAGGPLQYVVQVHAARRLHCDFRLELDGVLLSWAVPKGPSQDPADKRLAVETEPHPMSYATFEGVIPAGEYGGGPVLVWDRGIWVPDEDPHAGLEKGRLVFRLDGVKLHGGFRLIRTRPGPGGKAQWLLIKRRDEWARSGGDILAEQPQSVLSGRTLEEVRAGGEGRTAGAGQAMFDLGGIPGATQAALPDFVEPQRATLVKEPPAGEAWLAEIKIDGYRLLARKDGADVRLLTRSGADWTRTFPVVARAVGALAAERVLLDGEVAVYDDRGVSSFAALQQAIGHPNAPFLYACFDLLHQDGWDLRGASQRARKEALQWLIGRSPQSRPTVRYEDHVEGRSPDLFAEACKLGLEGIVCKRADAPYQSERTRDWLKVKCVQRQELAIVGYTPPGGSRKHLGALLLGVRGDEGKLVFAGKVGTGFTAATLADLQQRLEPLRQPRSALVNPPRERGVQWVKPELVAEVAFGEWTRDGRVRHPSFQGLREDKRAAEVRREEPVDDAPRHEPVAAPSAGKRTGRAEVAGVRLSNPGRVLFPDIDLTKLELARYYERVADWMVPYAWHRPLTMVRCPSGIEATCFYQKAAGQGVPVAVGRVDVGADDKYLMIEDVSSVVALVQMGVVEMHVWGSRAEALESPDMLVFDLDPGPNVSWARMVATALTMRDLLADGGLTAFLRATGGKGLHLVVPVEPTLSWDEAKDFTHAVASLFARRDPAHYTDKLSKSLREGKILIDYLRNAREATAIASWSARRREGAPIAVPLRWEELEMEGEGPPRWTVREVLEGRLPDGDPWEGFNQARAAIDLEWGKRILA